MNLNDHSRLRGKHALFSPSSPGFLSLADDEFLDRLISKQRTQLGTELHAWAFYKIKRQHKLGAGVRDAAKSFDEFIFSRYYNEQYDSIPDDISRTLKSIPYIFPQVYGTVRSYVNDAIGFRMKPETVVAYSDRFFGTTDALIFSNNLLRIHDLKTGATPAHIEQLLAYDALYCLEYGVNPSSIQHELRIYQGDDILVANPTGDDIRPFMDKIITFDELQRSFEEG